MYQTAAASSVSITRRLFDEMLLAAWISSVTPITDAIDVPLSMLMKSLPVGGMITRMACGSTTRRSVAAGVMPIDFAASVCPLSTLFSPARTISAMYALSLSARPRNAAVNALISTFVCSWTRNGMSITGKTSARLYQSRICSSTGRPRKIQM